MPRPVVPMAFLQQRLERDDAAVADEAANAIAQDARRDQRENGLLSADDERMPRVVSALKARDRSGPLR
jgi:hypothetical protein